MVPLFGFLKMSVLDGLPGEGGRVVFCDVFCPEVFLGWKQKRRSRAGVQSVCVWGMGGVTAAVWWHSIVVAESGSSRNEGIFVDVSVICSATKVRFV